jgi:retron-type reverse transcriptase
LSKGWGEGIRGSHIFEEIISLENLFLAWSEFKKGKCRKSDVLQFEYNLEENIFELSRELKAKIYSHSNYTSFYVSDPKLRKIHKACVRDRVLHHAIFRILYPIFDNSFIFDSYSCRNKKGTHKAVEQLNNFFGKAGRNNTKICHVLKCDVRKFFDSIDQEILINLLKRKIKDENAVWLIEKIIKSFPVGLPLGNITSQLFANIYLNELDRFIKRNLKIKYYIRYCDDFIILSGSKDYLINLIPIINHFLNKNLKLVLHPNKISIAKYGQGVDFLGYVSFPNFKVLRPKTKNRIVRGMRKSRRIEALNSYLGLLKHCMARKTKIELLRAFFKH